jgi:hypothetical protein
MSQMRNIGRDTSSKPSTQFDYQTLRHLKMPTVWISLLVACSAKLYRFRSTRLSCALAGQVRRTLRRTISGFAAWALCAVRRPTGEKPKAFEPYLRLPPRLRRTAMLGFKSVVSSRFLSRYFLHLLLFRHSSEQYRRRPWAGNTRPHRLQRKNPSPK